MYSYDGKWTVTRWQGMKIATVGAVRCGGVEVIGPTVESKPLGGGEGGGHHCGRQHVVDDHEPVGAQGAHRLFGHHRQRHYRRRRPRRHLRLYPCKLLDCIPLHLPLSLLLLLSLPLLALVAASVLGVALIPHGKVAALGQPRCTRRLQLRAARRFGQLGAHDARVAATASTVVVEEKPRLLCDGLPAVLRRADE